MPFNHKQLTEALVILRLDHLIQEQGEMGGKPAIIIRKGQYMEYYTGQDLVEIPDPDTGQIRIEHGPGIDHKEYRLWLLRVFGGRS